jgi:protein-export membrane protein SecD
MGAGNYNDQFAQSRDLALVLRAGALPVELEFQEQRIVGPSLGVDSINSARLASIIGSMLVFVFLIIWYKTSGAIAIFTLVFNVIIILASLIGLEATLTLPGIAGIALTVGMAVDANIIIYERIREELAVGAAKLQAIEAGFGKAFWTVLDANLTTAAAGIALLNFGTGPIRGFAVTLLIGIAATVYCSYFVGNLIFEYYIEKSSSKKISI